MANYFLKTADGLLMYRISHDGDIFEYATVTAGVSSVDTRVDAGIPLTLLLKGDLVAATRAEYRALYKSYIDGSW